MIQFESEKVFIEHCQNCSSHSWCTKHDESKYTSYYDACKKHIKDLCPELEIIPNQIPVHLTQKFTTTDSKPWEGKLAFPRLGSFEVYFKSKTIFSKLESGTWPQPSLIASKINETLNSTKLPQISKEKPLKIKPNKKTYTKIANSKQRLPRSTRSNQKRYKSTTPSVKEKSKIKDFSVRISDKKNEYDDEEFEQDLDVEEKREVTKVYELNLPAGIMSNKKINYVNKTEADCEFLLTSSDPVNMIVKESGVKIAAGESGKFQLRFAPASSGTREFLLNVDNWGKPCECFKFLVKYE